MVGLLEDHVITWPVIGLPAASRGVAVNWPVCPTARFKLVGLIVTDATPWIGTVMPAVAERPSLVAVMVADPTA